MQPFNTRTLNLSSCTGPLARLAAGSTASGNARGGVETPRHRGIVTAFTAMLNRFARTDDEVATRYAGCGWNDSTEREILHDVSIGQVRRSVS